MSVFGPLYHAACMCIAFMYFTPELFMLCEYACESRYVSACRVCALEESHYRCKKSKHLFSLLISLADVFYPTQSEVAPQWLISPSKRPPYLTTVPYLF